MNLVDFTQTVSGNQMTESQKRILSTAEVIAARIERARTLRQLGKV